MSYTFQTGIGTDPSCVYVYSMDTEHEEEHILPVTNLLH